MKEKKYSRVVVSFFDEIASSTDAVGRRSGGQVTTAFSDDNKLRRAVLNRDTNDLLFISSTSAFDDT